MDSFPAIAIASLAIALVFSTYYILWKPRPSSSQKLQPPEAGGAWPIIGHLRLLGGPQPPHITLGKLADKYGSIFTIRIGVQRAIVVSGSEIAKECFTTNDKAFANRPKAVASEHMAYNYAMFVFSSYGPYWRQLRRIATLELLSNHRLQLLGGVRESEVKTAVREIHEQWVKNGRVLVDMKRWFGDLTLNLALRTVVGKRCGRETSGDDRCREAIMEFFRLTGTFVLGDAIPWLRWFDFGGHEKAMKKTAKELDQILEGLLDEHKRMKRLAF